MTKRNKLILIHILGSLAFLIIPLLIYPHPPGNTFLFGSRPPIRDFTGNFFILMFFYFNYYYLIPQYFFNKHYYQYALFMLVGLVVISLLPSWLTHHLSPPPPMPERSFFRPHDEPNFIVMINHHIFMYITVMLFSVLLKTSDRLRITENAHHNAELNSLKAQINPHFLFNTLNNIYALALKDKSNSTADALLKLSGLMRYAVTETKEKLVPLHKEIDSINDYIELQKMRINEHVVINYIISGTIEKQQIAPLTLLPFIENAFKHGVNPDEKSVIIIAISIMPNQLTMNVTNNKVVKHLEEFEKSNTGLANTISRLELIYKEDHTLTIEDKDDSFKVDLAIKY